MAHESEHKKTKIMHVRRKPCKSTQAIFYLDGTELELVSKYKYVRFFFNEHMDMKEGINVLSEAAGRSLSGIIAKFASFRDAGFQTYTKPYESCVVPIMDYFSGKWGFLKYPAIEYITGLVGFI